MPQQARLLFALWLSTAACTDAEDPEIIASIAVRRCPAIPDADALTVTVSGRVVDFVTKLPVANATVDIAKVWETGTSFGNACSIANTIAGPNGEFGPFTVKAGPKPDLFDARYLAFMVQGSGVAPTISDARASCNGSSTCTLLDHEIAAPAIELAAEWRSELDDGGMSDAFTRGLIAFEFREASGLPAAHVTVRRATLFDRGPLRLGDDVRFLESDRATVAPADQPDTLSSGVALIGLDPTERGTRDIGGNRGSDSNWLSTGCLIANHWIFLEDRRNDGPLED